MVPSLSFFGVLVWFLRLSDYLLPLPLSFSLVIRLESWDLGVIGPNTILRHLALLEPPHNSIITDPIINYSTLGASALELLCPWLPPHFGSSMWSGTANIRHQVHA